MFLVNRLTLDGGAQLFWLAHIGPKAEAKKFKYTLWIPNNSGDNLLEATRRCVPCDYSHQEMKKKMCGIVVDKELIDEVAVDGVKGTHVCYEIIIEKV